MHKSCKKLLEPYMNQQEGTWDELKHLVEELQTCPIMYHYMYITIQTGEMWAVFQLRLLEKFHGLSYCSNSL